MSSSNWFVVFHLPPNLNFPFFYIRSIAVYRIRSRAVAASLMRGRGRVRIKSRDQRLRDLATLSPEVPLGHPTMRTSPFVTIQVARHDARLGAE